VIEVFGITIEQTDDPGSWQVYGLVRNISDEGLTDLELEVSIIGLDDVTQSQVEVLPALRQLSPGDAAPFTALFSTLENDPRAEDVLVELSSFEAGSIKAMELTIDKSTVRPNISGGTTFLGYFSNPQRGFSEIRNVGVYMLNEDGEPIDAAESILTGSLIAPRGQLPFRVDFDRDYDEVWPKFYIDAVPTGDPNGSKSLWSVQEPRLFLTSQKVPVYLLEITNTAFAPQKLEGMLALTEGTELVGLLPLRSPSLIPVQSSWFVSLEPSLELPIRLRNNEDAMRALIADIIIDPLASHGVNSELISLELEVESLEIIGGSLFLEGTLQNPLDRAVSNAVVHASLRDSTGVVVSAHSAIAAEQIEGQGSQAFLLSLWIPDGSDPNMLEFDLYADAVSR
jgi:hypothetical protein